MAYNLNRQHRGTHAKPNKVSNELTMCVCVCVCVCVCQLVSCRHPRHCLVTTQHQSMLHHLLGSHETARTPGQPSPARTAPRQTHSQTGLPSTSSCFRCCYSASVRRAEYCDDRVCLCVCLFVCPSLYVWKYTSNLRQIFYTCY